MNGIVAAIEALNTVPRRLRVTWVSAVVALPIIAVSGVWRLFHCIRPIPVPEVLLSAITGMTCGIVWSFVVVLPRNALRAVRREALR